MNLAEWLARTSRITPDAPALFHGTQLVATYGQFGARSAAIAGSLQTDFGIARGDRVAIFMKNRTEYLEASYGIWWAGAAAVPINAKLHPKEAAWIIENAGAQLSLFPTMWRRPDQGDRPVQNQGHLGGSECLRADA